MDAKKRKQIEEKLRRLIEAEDRRPTEPGSGTGSTTRTVQIIRRRRSRLDPQVATELS